MELAQPSLCSRIESDSVHGQGMYMESPTVLRYGTFVEIMVPLFSMDFFKGNVTTTLSTSASGASCLQPCQLDLPLSPDALTCTWTRQPPCSARSDIKKAACTFANASVQFIAESSQRVALDASVIVLLKQRMKCASMMATLTCLGTQASLACRAWVRLGMALLVGLSSGQDCCHR